VRLLRADGSQLWWSGLRLHSGRDDAAASFEAVEVSEDLVLRKRLRMPDMPESEVAQAVGLEAQAASPFAPADLVWRHHPSEALPGGGCWVEVVIASRAQVASYVDSQRPRLSLPAGEQPEAWVLASGDGAPIVLPGWGEQRRERKDVQHRRMAYVLVACALAIASLMAITPSLQLRSRSLEAVAAFDGLQRETAAIAAQREVFTRVVARLEALRAMLSERTDMLKLMMALTKALPDDTYLQSVQTQGLKVTIHGLTVDSAALMQTLGAVPGFKEVRAPSAATRSPGAAAENFRIEVQLDPALFALTAAVPAVAAGVAQQSAVPGPETAASASAPAASQPAVAASEPARRKSRFSAGF